MVKNVVKKVLDVVKSVLGIYLFLCEFMDVGVYLMLGFVKGIDNYLSKVICNVFNVVDKVVDVF